MKVLGKSITLLGPLGGANGSIALPPSSLRHVNQNIDTAQTQFYSLSLERQLARNTVLAIEYSGSHGVHLYDISAFNPLGGGQVYLHDPFDPTVGNYTRPNFQYSSINTRCSNGTSRYNGLNIRFQTNNLLTTGLSLTANYTWSHSLDDLSSTFSDSNQGASGNGIGNLGYLNPTNPKLDWGSSDYDIRHRVVIAPIWETPWFKSGKDWKRQALGGYTVVPVFMAHTGIPFSVFDTSFSLNAASGYGIPRYVPSSGIPSYTSGGPQQVGPNLFNVLTLPAASSFAFNPVLGISDFGPYPVDMTRRNSFRGPGAWNFDLVVGKSFALTERVRLQFRAEGFDLFNHHNLYLNAANLNVPNFTTASGANGPVLVQALKGGIGNLALGGNHDERRFGQFSLNLSF